MHCGRERVIRTLPSVFGGGSPATITVASTSEIKTNVENLALLFRSIDKPNLRTLIGLWAELFVVDRSRNVPNAIRAWHNSANDRFDCFFTAHVIEVKATMGIMRAHNFNLEQLSIPIGGSGVVVSIAIQALASGTSLLELARRIEERLLQVDLRSRLWGNLIASLGPDFTSSLDRRFDESFAERGLRIYSMDDIPKPDISSDSRITSGRFTVDCTALQPTQIHQTSLA